MKSLKQVEEDEEIGRHVSGPRKKEEQAAEDKLVKRAVGTKTEDTGYKKMKSL